MYKSTVLFFLVEAAYASLTSSQVCSWVTYEAPFPDAAYPVCQSDNCYNEMLDPRYNDLALAFCPTWLEGTPTTEAAAIPTYLVNCYGDVIAVSSACTCIAWSVTAAQVTATALPSMTQTIDSSAATATATAALCPATDGEVIVDANGVGYAIHCASDSDQGSYTSVEAPNSYLDCSTICDASSGCTAWAFTGTPGANGAGSGTCWLKTRVGKILTGYDNFILGVGPQAASASPSATVAASVPTGTAEPPATDVEARNARRNLVRGQH
ncbi:unnamed protein product [Discula destructiva]